MKRYNIKKFNSKTENEVNYGTMCEEDMKLVTRGYKQDKYIPTMYVRKGSKFFFVVEEIL